MKAILFTALCALLGLVLRPGQLAFARVAYDGLEPAALIGTERELARSIFGDVDEIPRLARSVVAQVKGRDIGGSRMGALRLVHLAATAPLDKLSPSELAFCFFGAPKLGLTAVSLRFALEAAEKLKARGAIKIEKRTSEGFTIVRADLRRVRCEVFAASRGGDAVRGVPILGALLDEAAFFLDEQNVVNDRDIFNAIVPRLLPGGQILVVSSPWGMRGLLFDEFSTNHGAPRTAIAAFCPTAVMRDEPEMQDMIATAYERDPVNAARELGASFASNEEALLSAGDVDAMIDVGVLERPPMKQISGWPVRYVIGLDVGLRHDGSGIVVAHHERDAADRAYDPIVVDYVESIAPKRGGRIELKTVEDAVVEVSRRYGNAPVWHDGHLADALAPRLKERGVKCHEAKMSSAPQADRASLLVQRARTKLLRLVEHPTLIAELKNLRLTRHAGGRISVAAPTGRNFHDDVSDALLLALEAAVALPASVPIDRLPPAARLEAKIEHEQELRAFVSAFGGLPGIYMTPEQLAAEQQRAEWSEIRGYLESGLPLPKLS
ncbi:MAG TPA: hypothetical protein VEQ59_07095 [Polyangiaceae bacterium]|nr:hypothetical protein [Polyangiaceae bacterium]